MKKYSYLNPDFESAEGHFSENWPLAFLRGTSLYHAEKGSEIILFHDPNSGIWMPVRFYKTAFIRSGQIIHAPFRLSEKVTPEEEQHFIRTFLLQLHQDDLCDRLQQPAPIGFMQTRPPGSQYCQYGTYRNLLSGKSDADLLDLFDVKYRKAVNHSVKNGARVSVGQGCFDDFYKLYESTIKKAGIFLDSPEEFDLQLGCYGAEHCEIGVVYNPDNQPIGSIYLNYTEHSAYCTHAGSTNSKLYGAMKFLHWEMMKYLRDKGVQYYDFAGTRIDSLHEELAGLSRFKRGFGGALISGYLWKKDIHPSICNVYDSIQRLRGYNRYPYTDIIDEETIYSHKPLKS